MHWNSLSSRIVTCLSTGLISAVMACSVALAEAAPATPAADAPVPYPLRWVFVSIGLGSNENLEKIKDIVKTASEHGYNGMVLSAGLDRIDQFDAQTLQRLKTLNTFCNQNKVDLIPLVFSVGYGWSTTRHNPNLVVGFPVKDSLFHVENGVAKHVPASPAPLIPNGGFETFDGNVAADFDFQDKAGEISFIDTTVFRSGKASIRFQDIHKDRKPGRARVMRTIKVKPYHCYKATMWAKTDALKCGDMTIYPLGGKDDKYLAFMNFKPEPTSDGWFKREVVFDSSDHDTIKIYAGVWGGKSGRYWMDDLSVEEMGIANILRRPGTPVTVKNKATGEVYEEGRDFEPIRDPKINYKFDHGTVDIRLTPDSRIKNGDALLVNYYFFAYFVGKKPPTLCMSEDALYRIWQEQITRLNAAISPKYYFFDMDEIRSGGSCEACRKVKKDKGWDMAEILGNCVTRTYNMVKAANPDAQCVIWSDMLAPTHNAHANFYLVDGDFTGSWKYIPKDMIIAVWGKGLDHFAKNGFRTIGAAYYDSTGTANGADWLKSLDAFPDTSVGIMYTTWRNNFKLMPTYGDMFLSHDTRRTK